MSKIFEKKITIQFTSGIRSTYYAFSDIDHQAEWIGPVYDGDDTEQTVSRAIAIAHIEVIEVEDCIKEQTNDQ